MGESLSLGLGLLAVLESASVMYPEITMSAVIKEVPLLSCLLCDHKYYSVNCNLKLCM